MRNGVAAGTWHNPYHLGGLALLLAFASFWIKLGEEEKLMRQQFPEQYRSYQQRVKRLIPFVL